MRLEPGGLDTRRPELSGEGQHRLRPGSWPWGWEGSREV